LGAHVAVHQQEGLTGGAPSRALPDTGP